MRSHLHHLPLLIATLILSACATQQAPERPHIVFVHGNGDNAAVWQTTIWRFESNGWPADHLHAIELPHPVARTDDKVPQAGRSSTDDEMHALADAVDAIRRAGAGKVVLVGNSRGGYEIRHYVQDGGGLANVSQVVLGGTPNHGVFADAAVLPGSEFNGAGPFLVALNAPKGIDGSEVTPGVQWLTLRSDHEDKYAQPMSTDGKATPTHVSYEGPALKGATNLVLPGVDHRETAFSPAAFAQMYAFIAGTPPATVAIVPRAPVVLDGLVSGYDSGAQTNLPLPGATVAVYAVDEAGTRQGAALLRKTIGVDGHWGPLQASLGQRYEFVVAASGLATTHVYRSPFPRSSSLVDLRPERLAEADAQAGAVLTFTRPRGYFGLPRDRMMLNGQPLAGVVAGVPLQSSARQTLPAAPVGGPVEADFDGEHLVGRSWPRADGEVTVLELTQ